MFHMYIVIADKGGGHVQGEIGVSDRTLPPFFVAQSGMCADYYRTNIAVRMHHWFLRCSICCSMVGRAMAS